jgi:iron complex outermembrane receptor protein
VVSARYGGKSGADTFYRVYAQYRGLTPTYLGGREADAATDSGQSGFRFDSRLDDDTIGTFQGDVYTNRGLARDGTRDKNTGTNFVARWQRLLSFDSDVQLSSYYDYLDRDFIGGLQESRQTVQVSGKYRRAQGRHEVQIGTDNLFSWDKIGNIPAIVFDPAERTVYSLGAFANHTYSWVPDRLSSMVGSKVEYNAFTGIEVQPTVRAGWMPSARTTAWTSVSRAVRTPTRFDHDIVFPGVFTATDEFKSEEVIACEAGVRHKPDHRLALDLAVFKNKYKNLRSYQPVGVPAFPLTFRNMLNAVTHGAEAMVLYQPYARLFIKGTYRYFEMEFDEDPESRNPFGWRFEANDPRHRGTLSVRVDLPACFEFDLTGRYVGSLPWQRTKGYFTADLRLGWHWKDTWEVALIGRDLLDHYHTESIIPQQQNRVGQELSRRIALRVTWKR